MLVGCGAREEKTLYREAAVWIEGYALTSERVAVRETAARYFHDRDVVALPEDGDTFLLLATLQDVRPDFVVVWPGIAWDSVRAQPWFQTRYRLLNVVSTEVQPHASLRIFGYTPSPFDTGEIVSVRQVLGTDGPELRAARVGQPRLTPGEPLYVTLFWGGDLFALPDAHRLVLRLVSDEDGHSVVQVEDTMVDGVPMSFVREGDDLLSNYTLAVPDDLPTGDYCLTLALYRRNLAPVVDEDVMLVHLYRPPVITREAPTPDFVGEWRVGDAIALVGYDVPERLSPGGMLRVALYWHVIDAVPDDYKVFVHLMDADGNLVAQDDAVPVNWRYPTTQWQPGEYIRDEHVLVLGETVPRGDYMLFVGLYDVETGIRLDVEDALGQESPDDRAELRVVKVR